MLISQVFFIFWIKHIKMADLSSTSLSIAYFFKKVNSKTNQKSMICQVLIWGHPGN